MIKETGINSSFHQTSHDMTYVIQLECFSGQICVSSSHIRLHLDPLNITKLDCLWRTGLKSYGSYQAYHTSLYEEPFLLFKSIKKEGSWLGPMSLTCLLARVVRLPAPPNFPIYKRSNRLSLPNGSKSGCPTSSLKRTCLTFNMQRVTTLNPLEYQGTIDSRSPKLS